MPQRQRRFLAVAVACIVVAVAGLGFVLGRLTAPRDDDRARPGREPGTIRPAKPASPSPRPAARPPAGDGQGAARGTARRAGFSPYVDASMAIEDDRLLGTAPAAGAKELTLAFITSGGGCTPTWGDDAPVRQDRLLAATARLRAQGGDVRVSFGGADGKEPAQDCTDETRLAAAYRQVIETYGLTKADFDIEGQALEDTAANERRGRVLALLQAEAGKAGRPLEVTFTLPVMPHGLDDEAKRVVEAAVRAGVDVSAVNIMAMNYGPEYRGDMGRYAIDAATATHAQLTGLLGLDDAADAWRALHVTAMIGVNDVAGEVFEPADAERLVEFARSKGLGGLAMWSLSRDRPCEDGPKAGADAMCSSIEQEPGVFLRAFTAYAGPNPAS
ncbi:chitinase [Streptomyces sp. NPDC048629]|uniref:chitinase n=1 Tax=Streptomyces sp. NPDC048629 TaxID=3154824 RepID=UPI00343AB453